MARILFGVMGDSFGHISRALTIAEEMPHHEFVFLGGGRVLDLVKMGYRVEKAPMLSTGYSNNRVKIIATISNGLYTLLGQGRIINSIVERIRDFNPHLVLTDYEYFSALVAEKLNIPCVSIDHQHFLTECICNHPRGQAFGRLLLESSIRFLYSKADFYLITSFFRLPLVNASKSAIFPPLLRRSVREITPTQGEHVLVYQTSPTFHKLLPALEALDRPCIIYGFGEDVRKNLLFKKVSEKDFLADLASCRYAVTNGGHNVISEALFYGKPVISFPIIHAYEQFYNAYALKLLGFGDYSLAKQPGTKLFEFFESNLTHFRSQIAGQNLCGNESILIKIEEIINGC